MLRNTPGCSYSALWPGVPKGALFLDFYKRLPCYLAYLAGQVYHWSLKNENKGDFGENRA